jgi:hypothetical protein
MILLHLLGKKLLTHHTKKKFEAIFLSDFCAFATPKNGSPHQKSFYSEKIEKRIKN